MLTAIDLFSGCGGLTLGLKRAGFKVVAAVEINKLAAKTYRLNHSEVPYFAEQDIREVNPYDVLDEVGLRQGQLSLLAGCPPCQGFSKMRTLNGSKHLDDKRNDLIFEFARFTEAMRPMAVLMENVPALANDQRFDRFRDMLEDLGYGRGDYRVLNAADYGVPQRRKRVVYIAVKGGANPTFSLPISKRRTVRHALAGLPPPEVSDDPIHRVAGKRSARIQRIIELIPKDGGSRKDLPDEYQLACHRNCTGFKDVYGRMSWNDVAPTITGGCFNPSKGRFLHPEENRAITMREAALLQDFPNDYLFPGTASISDLALMIGNAFPASLVKHQALPLAEMLKATPHYN